MFYFIFWSSGHIFLIIQFVFIWSSGLGLMALPQAYSIIIMAVFGFIPDVKALPMATTYNEIL